MIETIQKEWSAKLLIILFIILSVWWAYLNLNGLKNEAENYLFGATYGVVAFFGGVIGIHISQKWGFTRSVMGKAILFLALGLLAQEFGQLVFSYYNIFLHVEVPYPSIADIGFFGTIPLYIVALYYLIHASGGQSMMKQLSGKIQVILLPLVILIFSYVFFLQEYSIEGVSLIQVFLDFGYPLGQAVYLSMALLVYTLSKNFLGGIMRSKILFFVVALLLQYMADFNFLYQNSRQTWLNAGYGDYLYLVAYLLMAFGIVQLLTVFKNLRHQS